MVIYLFMKCMWVEISRLACRVLALDGSGGGVVEREKAIMRTIMRTMTTMVMTAWETVTTTLTAA